MCARPVPSPDAILADMRSGRFKPAFQAAKKAMSAAPGHPAFPSLAALALMEMDRPREAIPMFQKAMKLDPQNPGHQTNLLQALIKIDQPEKAVTLARQLLERRPDDPALLYLAAIAQANHGQSSTAIETITKALEIAPDDLRSRNFLGALLTETGHDKAAIAEFEKALTLDPANPEVLTNIAKPLGLQNRHDAALEALDHVLQQFPDHVGALENQAILLAELGRFDEARAACIALRQHIPNHAEAALHLANLWPRDDLSSLRNDLGNTRKTVKARTVEAAMFDFALALIARRMGDTERARPLLATANATAARLRPFDAKAALTEYENTTAAISSLPARSSGPSSSQTPIFIVGQPRSGTTMIEQALSANPDVTGCGELTIARRLVQNLLHGGTRFDPDSFAQEYLSALPDAAQATRFFTDKMPQNYRYLGYLAAAFPNARIIHITRDPRDVALSMWQRWFQADEMRASFDLKAMAVQANLYRRYMDHWTPLLGDQLLTISYEDAVSDFTSITRGLADFTGLDWSETMAHPERNTAPVRTASQEQVRNPVHSGSIGNWLAEAETLTPFCETLDPELWPGLR